MKSDQFNNQIIIYEGGGQLRIQVRVGEETVWLTQAQLVELYQSSKANVSEHIKNIFAEGELNQDSTVRNFRISWLQSQIYHRHSIPYLGDSATQRYWWWQLLDSAK